jgi:hypothetical protein
VTGDEVAAAMGVRLDDVAHIIQVALTPVFLLSGIGSLLNVINARLGRVADKADLMQERLLTANGREADYLYRRLLRLCRRLHALDMARACGTLAGLCICVATFALFMGALRNTVVATALFLSFGAAIISTSACLVAFFTEGLMAWNNRVPRPEQDNNLGRSPTG